MTKIKLQVMAVVCGVLLFPVVATAATTAPACDKVWGNPDTYDRNIVGVRKALNIASGDVMVPRANLGKLLIGYSLKNCKEQFNGLPKAKQTPIGFVHHAMGVSNKLPAGEWTSEMELAHVERLVREGLVLGLPTVRQVRAEQLNQAVQTVKQGEALTGEDMAKFGNSLRAMQAELKKSKQVSAETAKLAAATEAALKSFQVENGLKVEHLANLQKALQGELEQLRAVQHKQGLQITSNSKEISAIKAGNFTKPMLDVIADSVEPLVSSVDGLSSRLTDIESSFDGLRSSQVEMQGAVSKLDSRVSKVDGLVPSAYLALGALLLIGIALIWFGRRQRTKDQLVEEQVDRVTAKISSHDEQLEELQRVVNDSQSGLQATHSLAKEANETAVHVAEAIAEPVEFAPENPSVADLKVGVENAVEWQCRYRDELYVIKI